MPEGSLTKVAIVTGSNKGIGFAIVKGLLANNYPGVVYLTSRNEELGQEAVRTLQGNGLKANYHQLDITTDESVNELVRYIQIHYGGIDLLVNNAAIKYSSTATESLQTQITKTLEVNYYGTRRVCEAFMPLLRKNAQIINVSSAAGHICAIPDINLRSKFSMNITVKEIDLILDDYANTNEDQENYKWKNIGYVLSKVAVCAYTVAQQKVINDTFPERNIRINSVHPGYVKTDMTSGKGIQSPEDGAKSTLFLALNDKHEFRGDFIWYDCKQVDWISNVMPKDIKP